MKHSILFSALIATLALAACDRPTVVNNPPPAPVAVPVPVPVPGPAGPAGEKGAPGTPGAPGGDSTTVIVVPPASAPSK